MSINSPETWNDEYVRRMAREWYGYGWWETPLWFIGPEPGRPEKADTLKSRCEAWIKLGAGELIDCKCHHFGFGWYNWHRETPPPRTQPTWRQLIRVLLALSNGRSPSLEEIRSYQQHLWGMRTDKEREKSCVIELCCLAGPTLKAKKNVPFDPNYFVGERIKIIQRRMQEYKPNLVVMYGLSHREHYEKIAGCVLVPDDPVRIGPTCAVLTPHPVSHGRRNSDWLQLADKPRKSSVN